MLIIPSRLSLDGLPAAKGLDDMVYVRRGTGGGALAGVVEGAWKTQALAQLVIHPTIIEPFPRARDWSQTTLTNACMNDRYDMEMHKARALSMMMHILTNMCANGFCSGDVAGVCPPNGFGPSLYPSDTLA